jgi:hypothetical protein
MTWQEWAVAIPVYIIIIAVILRLFAFTDEE